jgi:hypothetical protein
MQDETKTEKCVAPGLRHNYEFTQAAYGYSCWICTMCGDAQDEIEDSQP